MAHIASVVGHIWRSLHEALTVSSQYFFQWMLAFIIENMHPISNIHVRNVSFLFVFYW